MNRWNNNFFCSVCEIYCPLNLVKVERFVNKILRKFLFLTVEKVAKQWIQIHVEELLLMHTSPNIIGVMK